MQSLLLFFSFVSSATLHRSYSVLFSHFKVLFVYFVYFHYCIVNNHFHLHVCCGLMSWWRQLL